MIIKSSSKRNLLLTFLFFIVTIIFSQRVLFAGNFQNVEILKEENRNYSFKDIQNNPNLEFEKYLNEGEWVRENKSYWLRFIYQKKESQTAYYLYSPFLLFQKLDLYYIIDDSLHHYQSGVSLDFDKRNLFLPSLYLELPLKSTPTNCWLHVVGFFGYSYFFAERDSKSVIKKEIQYSNLDYFFIGLSCLAVMFSLIFYIFLKDRLYLYYGIFSLMLIFSRLTHSGYIFNYVNTFYEFNTLKSMLNMYAITYSGITLAMLFYFYEYLKFYQRSKSYYITFYSLAIIRFVFLIIQLNFDHSILDQIIDYRAFELIIQFFILVTILRTSKKYLKPSILAAFSIIILIMGNLIFILPNWGNSIEKNFYLFLDFTGIEVILFAITMAYRSYFLKKEHERALGRVIENLREKEQLKDQLNKELEIKVEERTQQIQEMNELLRSHNIELKSEVKTANQARVFQKIMDFKDFQKIFLDDRACYQYLAKLKWNSKDASKCKKCGYDGYTISEDLSRRCGKCGYVESVTNGTLFQRLKFPILKAFYITYRTSTATKDSATLTELSEEIELRQATLWTFKQKVIALMESNNTKKKHKDGWTHLIEYSLKKM